MEPSSSRPIRPRPVPSGEGFRARGAGEPSGWRSTGAGGGKDELAIIFRDRRHLELVEGVAVWVGKTVPAPVAEDAEGHGLFVVLGEGLEAGDVKVEGKASVAHGHRAVGIDGVDFDVVAANEGVTIAGGSVLGPERGR